VRAAAHYVAAFLAGEGSGIWLGLRVFVR